MKKVIALTLATVLASGTTVFASGNVESFTDYNKDLGFGKLKGHWAESNIRTLYEKGGISGYPDGDFRANKTISGAELIALVLKASNNGDNLTGDSWSDKIMNRAYELGIVSSDVISKADANKPITREKMAVILANSAKNILNEEAPTKLVDEATIKDLNKATHAYKDEIRTAYSMGLLAGSGNGNYNPQDSTKRAEATAIINRLFGYTNRVTVKYEAEKPAVPETPQVGTNQPGKYVALPDGSNVGNKTGAVYPSEGQVGPDGKTIQRDKETGVLGYGNGQQGGIYLGVEVANGVKIKAHSSKVPDNYDNVAGSYTERGGAVFWDAEWGMIENSLADKLWEKYPNPEAGAVADLYGNLIPGGKMEYGKANVDNAVFVGSSNGWCLVP